MSSFPGIVTEIRGISIDNFTGENLKSTSYFLSHCHSDHMVGLSSPLLEERFKSKPWIKLYCHPVTKALLAGLNRFKGLIDSIEVLELQEERLLSTFDDDGKAISCFTVSIIPAGHCPGSVMFLLQTEEKKTVLYTGDFRYHIGESLKIRELYDEHGKLWRPIHSVYLDTTFCIDQASFIPTRESCCDLIISTIRDWLHRDTSNIVHIFSRSNYGYEFLMSRLSSEFECKMHITEAQYDRYRFVESIVKTVSTNITRTGRIHFCQNTIDGQTPMCITNAGCNVLTIIPTAMYFTKSSVTPTEMFRCVSERRIRVCYSTHSSYSEIMSFIKPLKPCNIYPCVMPNDSLSLEDVRQSLAHLENKHEETKQEVIITDRKITFKRKRALVL